MHTDSTNKTIGLRNAAFTSASPDHEAAFHDADASLAPLDFVAKGPDGAASKPTSRPAFGPADALEAGPTGRKRATGLPSVVPKPVHAEAAKTERRAGALSGVISGLAALGGGVGGALGCLFGAAWPLTLSAFTVCAIGVLGYLAYLASRARPAVVERIGSAEATSQKAA